MMGKYSYCKTCKNFHNEGNECPPIHFVYHPDYGTDPVKVYANNRFDAALKFAEDYDNDGDSQLARGTVIEALVIGPDGEKEFFKLSGEPTIDYNADEVAPEKLKDLKAFDEIFNVLHEQEVEKNKHAAGIAADQAN